MTHDTGPVAVPKRHFSMLRDFHLADFLTLGNGACGTAAIFFALAHVQRGAPLKVYFAGVLVALALAFDVMDGRVARWRHSASPMGRELDSLADVISFGVAPAVIAFSIGFDGFWDQLVLLYFVCCGISRLARYNITAEAMSADAGKVTYFEGTPIPTSSVLVVLMVLLTWADRVGTALPLGAVGLGPAVLHPAVLAFALSGSLMISKTIHIPKP